MGYKYEEGLEDAMISSASLTDVDKFKVLGSNTDLPADQVIVGATFRQLFTDATTSNATNVGTVEATYGTVVEEGDGNFHKTTITLNGAFPAIAGGAALAVGRKIYTFPLGDIRIISSVMSNMKLQQTEGNVTADTPDLGLGYVIASGANALLSANPTFESILTGQTMADCDGTAKYAGADAAIAYYINPTPAIAVYLNVADTWAASGDVALGFTGTVVITWEFLS